MKRPWFGVKTIRGQLMLVVLFSVASVIVTGRVIESISTVDYVEVVDVDLIGQRASTLAYLLDTADPSERQRIIARSAEVGVEIDIMPKEAVEQLPGPEGLRSTVGSLLAVLFPPDEVLPQGTRIVVVGKNPVLTLPINRDEVLLYKSFPDSILTKDFTGALLYYSLSFLTLGVLFWIFAVRFLTAPLSSIASQIDDTDRFLSQHTPLAETGSLEIARLARALNDMRTRIHEMMRGRTAMLRSVSHDLRTPLTRARLRAERLDDVSIREPILSDIHQINTMIDITLDYLRDDRSKERIERTDIASIMQTISDDFSDTGAKITYSGSGRFILLCKPMAMTRAITNLCENGVKFAGEVEMALVQAGQVMHIDIRDYGPGIPEEFRQRVLEPFFQIDSARARTEKQAGFGLGLSIVDEIVRDHGGRIEFETNVPHGCVVRLVIPIPA